MKALVGANLIDGTGGPVVQDSVVLLDGDIISAVGARERGDHSARCRGHRPLGYDPPPWADRHA